MSAPPVAGNPWFRQWPRDGRSNPLAQAVKPKTALKGLPQFFREGNYPARFAQVIPFEFQTVAKGTTQSVAIKFDDDFPFRMDALVFDLKGYDVPAAFARVLVDLPSGRRLTRQSVDPSAFNGQQGGKAFVHFRYRFAPSDVLVLNLSNLPTAPAALTGRGFVYGYKLTGEARL